MKLEEARKLATPGPLVSRTGKSEHAAIYIQGTSHNVAVGVKPITSALLAHSYNMLPELVETLEQWVAASKEDRWIIEDHFVALLDKAEEVPGI